MKPKMVTKKIQDTVVHIIDLLVRREYTQLESDEGLSAEEMKQAIEDYPASFIVPPQSNLEDLIDVVEVDSVGSRTWSVNVDLWSVEEGRSDLTLTLTLTDSPNEFYAVEVDDIHVL